ncbi:MAG: hypothetical protein ISR96_11630, partial [Nitrospira sp.]|nr:hypothetical protein [Nitrospira sp.]
NVSNDNGNYHVGANADYEFADALEGLKLGAHWYKGKVNGYDPDSMDLSQSLLHMLGVMLISMILTGKLSPGTTSFTIRT